MLLLLFCEINTCVDYFREGSMFHTHRICLALYAQSPNLICLYFSGFSSDVLE